MNTQNPQPRQRRELLELFLTALRRDMPPRARRVLAESVPFGEMRAKMGFGSAMLAFGLHDLGTQIMRTIVAECRCLPELDARYACPLKGLEAIEGGHAPYLHNWLDLHNWLKNRNDAGRVSFLRFQLERTVLLRDELVRFAEKRDSRNDLPPEVCEVVVLDVAALFGVLAELQRGQRRRDIAARGWLGRLLARFRNEEAEWPWLRGNLLHMVTDCLIGAPHDYRSVPLEPGVSGSLVGR